MGQCSSWSCFSLGQLDVEKHVRWTGTEILLQILPTGWLTFWRDNSLLHFVHGVFCLFVWKNNQSQCCHLAKDLITDALCKVWKHVKILVINECHSCQIQTWKTCIKFKKLRKLTKQNRLYGGVSTIFWRLSPTATHHDKRSFVCWIPQKHHVGNAINCPIFLEKSSI